MSWTDERVEQLSRLWLEGRSASQIATAMGGGLTRNAVIGKVHRLGLAGRVKSTTAAAAEETAVEAAEAVAAGARMRAVGSGGGVAAVQGNVALAMAPSGPAAPPAPRAPAPVVVPMSLRVTISDLRESMCKWPLGDPSSHDFRYCGSPSHNGTPYCQHHGKLAYQPAQDRRRERDRRPLLAR